MYLSPSHHTRALPREYSAMVPQASDARVLLVRDGKGWTLPHVTPHVTDFRLVHHTPAISRWDEAVRLCAQRHVAQAGHVHAWLARGCLDRRLPRTVRVIQGAGRAASGDAF